MELPLTLHLSIHFFLAILTGYFSGLYFKKPIVCLISGFLGGFLIDLDHVLEYFFVYGPSFNFRHFCDGWQFLVSGRVYLIFHAWEYIPLLAILVLFLRKRLFWRAAIITLTLAGSVHLFSDLIINNYPFRYYVISYRAQNDFSAQRLLSPDQYEKMQETKSELGL